MMLVTMTMGRAWINFMFEQNIGIVRDNAVCMLLLSSLQCIIARYELALLCTWWSYIENEVCLGKIFPVNQYCNKYQYKIFDLEDLRINLCDIIVIMIGV